MPSVVVSVVIDLDEGTRYRIATLEALTHAAHHLDIEATIRPLPTARISEATLADLGDAVVIGPGTPYAVPEAAEEVIRSARERGVPLVGT